LGGAACDGVRVYAQWGIRGLHDARRRAAQAHPERYRDLVVRVAGFSAFFVSLTRDMQDEIIARTAHS
jgi:pyruvate-formate lyase